MAAEAREFRESQAIEKAIKEDPAKREAWINRQLSIETVLSRDPELVADSLEE